MITSTIRNSTLGEKRKLRKPSRSLYKATEEFILNLIFITLILLSPLLVYDHFKPVNSDIQGATTIVVVLVALTITIWITYKFNSYKKSGNNNISQVEVVKVSSSRAIKREDFEDLA